MQRTGRGWTWELWIVLGGVLAASAGAVLLGRSVEQHTASFGWFAYAPLSSGTLSPASGVPTAGELFGYGIAVVGFTILAWTLGFRVSPRAAPALPVAASRRLRVAASCLAGAALLLVLGGGALLATAPPSVPLLGPLAEPGLEVSSAYGSSLVVAYDGGSGSPWIPGVVLLLVGLGTSATALGRRAGRGPGGKGPEGKGPGPGTVGQGIGAPGGSDDGTDGAGAVGAMSTRSLRPFALGGSGCLLVGLLIALVAGRTGREVLPAAGLTDPVTLGWSLLVVGVALGSGLAGYVVGAHPGAARRP
ncbi:hypothetical protein FJV46_08470 [Arthrobacter agilis]|uniref:hypothetical protein n=1 Tax=Arthrobacter agilis TaxID=37921 RepID=UPI000B35399E|nr:hypothetical protein [Arthrobacter agilis]OUM43160.1 hypothetical protein B8W74_07995 [Arthrobacter agilis]PPB46104.1 hypothetical protein CI784_10195 [Arthrobacter agilis]TPV25646.1 hypothetical protein FJV46_08470 [Arthrobacter agilis]VDR33422.1 Uncharacterised protein [Arthrobacter agilis]